MVISASTLACSVGVTCSNTLVAIFHAEKIWKSLRVFRCVRGYAVTTDAVVGEFVLCCISTLDPSPNIYTHRVAVIGFCGSRCTWKLQAEQRAGGHLGLAPAF
jgi:dienelactone hydrolase